VSRRMRNRIFIFVVIWAALWLGVPRTTWSQEAKIPDANAACAASGLPEGLQKKLSAQFASWKIQGLGDLSPSAAARWAGGYYTGCPGIAAGEFREKRRQSCAILLVPHDKPDSAYRLVIYSQASGDSAEEFAVVERRDAAGASNFFVNTGRLDELFDEDSRRKSHMSAKDAVLLFDAGETEYEVDAYYWSENAYRNSAVDV